MSVGKAKIRHLVHCPTHGVESKNWAGRMVPVPKPLHKRDKLAGCPVCNAMKKTT